MRRVGDQLLLSDESIKEEIKKGKIVIKPYEEANVQPSTVDLTLGDKFRVFQHSHHSLIDVKKPMEEYTRLVEVQEGRPYILHPFEFVLGTTREYMEVPDDMVARLDGKSSLGRLGVLIHSTAGYVDPGFKGHITLEILNVGKIPVTLYPGMRIAQVSFIRMTTKAQNPYGTLKARSRYQGQVEPTESRIFLDYKEKKKE